MREDLVAFPSDPGDTRPLLVELLGESFCDGTYRIARSGSRINVLEYVLNGSGTLSIEGNTFVPRKGDLYIVPEMTTHEYRSSADDPWRKIWFNVRGPLVGRLLDCYGLAGVYHVPDCPAGEIFRRAHRRIRARPGEAHEAAALALHQVIALAGGLHQARLRQENVKSTAPLKAFLDRECCREVTLEEMCRVDGRSPAQVIRAFRREWGMTPYRYLLDRRIELADRLLVNTMKPLKEIARELGFADVFYFSNMFQKRTGIRPSLRRQWVREKINP